MGNRSGFVGTLFYRKNMKIIFVMLFVLLLAGLPVKRAVAKSHWLRGALIGAGTGALGGGVGIYAWCDDEVWDVPDPDCGDFIPYGAIGGGAVGFGLGAAIGSVFKKQDAAVQVTVDPVTNTYGALVNMKFPKKKKALIKPEVSGGGKTPVPLKSELKRDSYPIIQPGSIIDDSYNLMPR